MCLAIPVKVLKIENNKAIADYLGKKQEFGTELVQDLQIGDFALASNGFIIKKISADEADEIFKIINPQNAEKEEK